MPNQDPLRWYTRPVLFVADVHRAIPFYVDVLRFEKAWHTENGAGGICQVNRGECEIILCEDANRHGQGRLFIELTLAGIAELRSEISERSIPSTMTQWGYETIQIDDPDGNELFFPIPE